MLKRTLEQLFEEKKPPLSERVFFWVFAGLFFLGILKVEERIEE